MSDRSASPVRDEPKPKKQKKSGGFKWKDKKSKDDGAATDSKDSGRLERGYRDRSPRRESYRDRDQEDGVNSRRDDRLIHERNTKSEGNDTKSDDRARNLEGPEPSSQQTLPTTTEPSKPKKDKSKSSSKPKRPPAPAEPMIIVNINDRLGTKAAIPCLASDSVKAFRAIVAAHIGRQPHEILIKRQGERPFKDALTLEDYGVRNGVQLDLELDTGD